MPTAGPHVAQQARRDQPHRWDESRQMLPFMQNVLPSGHAHTEVTHGPHPISGGPQVTSTYKLFSCDSTATTGLKRTRPLVKEGSKSGHWGPSTEGCRPTQGWGVDRVRRPWALPHAPRARPSWDACPRISERSTDTPFIVTHASRFLPATIFLISAVHPIERRTEERQNRKP